MDWSSDSDKDTHEAKQNPVCGSGIGASKEIMISDSDENHGCGWDTDEAEVLPAHTAISSQPRKPVFVTPDRGYCNFNLQSCAAEAGPSNANCTSHFVAMGFSEKLVAKAIKQNGEGDPDGILETLLTYGAIDKSPSDHEEPPTDCRLSSVEGESDDDFSGMENFEFEDITDDFAEKDKIVSTLVEMGFLAEEASSAIDRCGPNTPILELADSIRAAQLQEDSDDQLWVSRASSSEDVDMSSGSILCRRKKISKELERKHKRPRIYDQKKDYRRKMMPTNDDDDDDVASLAIPQPMIGFGLPFQPPRIADRNLPDAAVGPPFFYYENVALAPKGVWETISRFLYDIKPEFVDSKFFCAAARKRGYIHNLPVKNRFPLLPIPPKTIHEAFPATKKWWPAWDTRTHLNCLQTCIGSAKLTERLRSALAESSDPPSERVQKFVLYECRKWNLVWIGLHKLAVLEPDEIEMLLGFPRNHTRGIARTDRYKSLGNSFQVDTVAYHLSVLKDMFPNGITVLSLFSGIGGAEVALHRLGIRLKVVVSVELSDNNRNIVRSWWDQTNQTGTLIHISDVQQLNGDRLEHYINTYGGFDLVIGGSPCNNLAGSNRHHRDGLEGEHSALFYDYFRILDLVKCIMGRN